LKGFAIVMLARTFQFAEAMPGDVRPLGGVFGAALRLLPSYRENLVWTPFYGNDTISQIVSTMFFVGLCAYVWFGSFRGKKEIPWSK
jgi:hypothetical protein